MSESKNFYTITDASAALGISKRKLSRVMDSLRLKPVELRPHKMFVMAADIEKMRARKLRGESAT